MSTIKITISPSAYSENCYIMVDEYGMGSSNEYDGQQFFEVYSDYAPIIQVIAKDGNIIKSVSLDNATSSDAIQFTKKSDTLFEFEGNLTTDTSHMYITFESSAPPTPPTPVNISGFNHLYKVDNTILKAISVERFANGSDSIGEYIINILELPFDIDSKYLSVATNNIKIGASTTNVTALEFSVDEIEINLGSIFTPYIYNNSYDFINTTINLHLPFIDTIELDINYVIGYNITITYILDLYFGEVTVNIKSDKTNKIIKSIVNKIGRNIPFVKIIGSNTINNLGSKNGLNNAILKPFIEVIRNKPKMNDVFNNIINTNEKLINVKGFVTINNITLNSSATLTEKNNIINILKNGIYIK